MAKREPIVLVAATLGVTGLVLLLRGLLDGVPFIYWGTTEEHASREYGRLEILGACGVLVVAGALISLRRSVTYGIAVAAVGPITAMVTLLMPGTAAAWLAFYSFRPSRWVRGLRSSFCRLPALITEVSDCSMTCGLTKSF